MTNASNSIELEVFEHIRATPRTALLRVAVRLPGSFASGGRPTLLLRDGQTRQRLSPLPAPRDIGGVLRTAYSIPLIALGEQATFALEFSDGTVLDLPAPVEGRARVAPAAYYAQQVDDYERRTEEREAALSAARASVVDLEAAVIDAKRMSAEMQLEYERLRTHSRELEDTLARDAAKAADELSAAQAAVAQANDRAKSAMAEAAAARAQAEPLVERNAQLEQIVGQQTERIEHLEPALAEAERSLEELRRELAVEKEVSTRAEQSLARARDELHLMTFERDELTRQVAAFDAVAVKARQRAKEAEEAGEQSASALRDLENWRIELERRLAAMTSELSTAKISSEAADAAATQLRGALAEAEAKVELAEARSANLDADVASLQQQLQERDVAPGQAAKASAQARDQAEQEILEAKAQAISAPEPEPS